MAGAFDTRIEVDDRLTAPLKRLRDAGGDMSAPFAEISEAVLGHTLERYKREVGPDGVPWKRRKNDRDASRPVLWLHGDLYNSLERDSGADFAAVGVLGLGGPARYARRHQFGDAKMPSRPFLGIEERDLESVERIIIEHFQNAADGGGVAA